MNTSQKVDGQPKSIVQKDGNKIAASSIYPILETIIYLSNMFIEGEILPQDFSEARKILDEINDKSDASWLYLLGLIELKENNYHDAFQLFQQSSKSGKSDAMFDCGKMLLDGNGIDKNEFEGQKKNGCSMAYKPKNKEKEKKPKEKSKKKSKISNQDFNKIKVVFVGSEAVGKSYLIRRLINNKQELGEHVQTIFDNASFDFKYNDHTIKFILWDTSGSKTLESIRVLSYTNTDVFALVFSLVEPNSFDDLFNIWIHVFRQYFKDPTFIIFGTKLDLWNESQNEINGSHGTKKYVHEKAKINGIQKIVFVSNKTLQNIDVSIQEIINTKYHENDKSCNIAWLKINNDGIDHVTFFFFWHSIFLRSNKIELIIFFECKLRNHCDGA